MTIPLPTGLRPGSLRGLVLALATLLVTTGVRSSTPAEDPHLAYERQLLEVRRDPAKADWMAFRRAVARGGAAVSDPPGFDATAVAFELGNGERVAALLTLDRLMTHRWFDVKSHLQAADLCLKADRRDRAAGHLAAAAGLLDAARSSGDGRSRRTAWQVLNQAEAAAILDDLGIRPSSLQIERQDDRVYWLAAVGPGAPDRPPVPSLYFVEMPETLHRPGGLP